MTKLLKKMISNITIGSDPEFFIIKYFEDATMPIPAYEIIPAGKFDPIDFGGGYKVLTDNVLVEGNIPPVTNKEDFIAALEKLKSIIQDHFLAEIRCSILEEDSFAFTEEQLADDRAQEFGCAPYINAWTRKSVHLRGLDSENKRPAGFHIHVGYDLNKACKYKKKEVNIALTRAFDFFVVHPSNQLHFDEFRQKYYGGYGKMRNTSYGVEFRSLGAHFSKKEYLGHIYDATMKAINYCAFEKNIAQLLSLTEDKIGKISLETTEVETVSTIQV